MVTPRTANIIEGMYKAPEYQNRSSEEFFLQNLSSILRGGMAGVSTKASDVAQAEETERERIFKERELEVKEGELADRIEGRETTPASKTIKTPEAVKKSVWQLKSFIDEGVGLRLGDMGFVKIEDINWDDPDESSKAVNLLYKTFINPAQIIDDPSYDERTKEAARSILKVLEEKSQKTEILRFSHDGITYSIPSDRKEEFLKDNPGAKSL